MRSIILIIASVILVTMGYAQEISVKLERTSNKISRTAYNQLSNSLQTDFDIYIDQDAYCVLTPILKKSKGRTIEGFDTRTVGKSKLILRIKNRLNASTEVFKKSVDISYSSDADLVTKILRDKSVRAELKEKLYTACDISCDEYGKLMDTASTITELHRLENSLVEFSDCSEELSEKLKAISARKEAIACDQLSKDIEVLIAGGSVEQLNRAVNLILGISPSVVCYENIKSLIEKLDAKSDTFANRASFKEYRSIFIRNDVSAYQKFVRNAY